MSNDFDTLLDMCSKHTIDKEQIVGFIEHHRELDINDNGSILAIIIGTLNQRELMKLLVDSYKLDVTSKDVIEATAHSGSLECLKYLADERNLDLGVLKGSTAYSNYNHIKTFLNEYFTTHIIGEN